MKFRREIADRGLAVREMPTLGRATSPGRVTVTTRARISSPEELTGRGSGSGTGGS